MTDQNHIRTRRGSTCIGALIIVFAVLVSSLPFFLALPSPKSYGMVRFSSDWSHKYFTLFFAKVNEPLKIGGFPPASTIIYGGMVEDKAVFTIQTAYVFTRTVYVPLNTPFYSGVADRWFKPTMILPDQVNVVECDKYGN